MGTMSGQEIYEVFADSTVVEEWRSARSAARTMADEMRQLAEDVQHLRRTMDEAWQGSAAGLANEGAAPLAAEFRNNADNLRVSEDLLGRQADSFVTARNRVRPMPPLPTAADVIGAVLGGPNMRQVVQHYLDTAAHNVDVYTAYRGASRYNTTNLPTDFGRVAADHATITAVPAAPTPAPARPASTPAASTPPASTRATAAPTGRHARQDPSTPATAAPPAARDRAIAALAARVPPSADAVALRPAAAPPPSAPASSTLPAAAMGPSPWTPPPADPPPADPAALTSVPVSVRGPAAVDPAPMPAVGPVMGRAPGADAPVTARGSAVSPPAASPERTSGIAPVAGRRGERDDDAEHRSPDYLKEADPDGLFGPGVRATPPVIGA